MMMMLDDGFLLFLLLSSQADPSRHTHTLYVADNVQRTVKYGPNRDTHPAYRVRKF